MRNFLLRLIERFFPSPPAFKPEVKEIEVSGQKTYIRSLSAGYALSLRGKDLGDSQIFDVLSKSVCDKNGKPIITPKQAEEMGLTTVNQLVKEVMAFNSMAPTAVIDAKDELKKTEDLTTNSPAS